MINQLFISGYSELCPTDISLMTISVNNSYDVHTEICNLQIYNVTQSALRIYMEYTSGSLLIKDSTLTYIGRKSKRIYALLASDIPDNNVSIIFENCAFYYNVAEYILMLLFNHHCLNERCTHSSIIKKFAVKNFHLQPAKMKI